jgi:predicted MFS family arabinose efflux permease
MLIAGQCILMYRCLTYAISAELSYGAWLTTFTQLLHGIGFSMTWSAAALQADQIAPVGLKSSAQGLLNMAFNGVGSGIGALVGGIIYEKFGGQAMWLTVVCICVLSILLYTSSFLNKTLFSSIALLVEKYK